MGSETPAAPEAARRTAAPKDVTVIKDIFARVTQSALESIAEQMTLLAEECERTVEAEVIRVLPAGAARRLLPMQRRGTRLHSAPLMRPTREISVDTHETTTSPEVATNATQLPESSTHPRERLTMPPEMVWTKTNESLTRHPLPAAPSTIKVHQKSWPQRGPPARQAVSADLTEPSSPAEPQTSDVRFLSPPRVCNHTGQSRNDDMKPTSNRLSSGSSIPCRAEATLRVPRSNRLSSGSSITSRAEALQGNVASALQKAKKAPVFADADAMKEHVRAAIAKPEYKVTDFYRDDGICQKVARSSISEYITLAVISFNAVWIAVDADYNHSIVLADAHPIFQVTEHFFCTYFTIEIAIRFLAFKNKSNALQDFWFVFDSGMACLMTTETWLLPLLMADTSHMGSASLLKIMRILRLTRMARMAKLLVAFPELFILCRGVAVASRSVFFTLCLLVMVIYVFAVAFRQITDGTEIGESEFSTVPAAMMCLLLKGTLPDVSEIVFDVAGAHPAYGAMLMVFILLASLTVMNMLVGVLVEVVSVVSSVEKEQMIVTFVKQRFGEICAGSGISADMEGSLSPNEFHALLMDPKAVSFLSDIGVDVVGLVEYIEFFFKDAGLEDGEDVMRFSSFMELLLQLRGANQATVKDIVDLRKFMVQELRKLETRQNNRKLEIQDVAVRATAVSRARTRFLSKLRGEEESPSTSPMSSPSAPSWATRGRESRSSDAPFTRHALEAADQKAPTSLVFSALIPAAFTPSSGSVCQTHDEKATVGNGMSCSSRPYMVT